MQSQLVNSRNYSKSMDRLQHIFDSIAKDGFSDVVLQEIKNYTKDIQNGTEDFPRFNLSEHAGLSKGGAPLIGASIIACYATASLTASRNVDGCEGFNEDDTIMSHEGQNPGVTLTFRSFDEEGVINNLL